MKLIIFFKTLYYLLLSDMNLTQRGVLGFWGLAAGRTGLDDGHPVPVAQQFHRAGSADDAGADHHHVQGQRGQGSRRQGLV